MKYSVPVIGFFLISISSINLPLSSLNTHFSNSYPLFGVAVNSTFVPSSTLDKSVGTFPPSAGSALNFTLYPSPSGLGENIAITSKLDVGISTYNLPFDQISGFSVVEYLQPVKYPLSTL